MASMKTIRVIQNAQAYLPRMLSNDVSTSEHYVNR